MKRSKFRIRKGNKGKMRRSEKNGRSGPVDSHCCMTIVWFVAIYLVFNIPYSVIYLYVQVRRVQVDGWVIIYDNLTPNYAISGIIARNCECDYSTNCTSLRVQLVH